MAKNSFAGLIGSKGRIANNPDLAIDVSALATPQSSDLSKEEPIRRNGGTKPIQASRNGKLQISAFFAKNAKKQFEILCVEMEKNQTEMLTEAINDLFKKYGKPPIA